MTLHETWAAAKKQAVKDFKTAQKNYLKEQDRKINASNDAKARKKALEMVLDEAGLDKGESLDDYLKFADGFGKVLDALEKAVDNNATLNAKTKLLDLHPDIDKLLADKDVAKQLLAVAQRTANTAGITFYVRDYKKSPQEIWDQYIEQEAFDLSLAPDLHEDWKHAASSAETLKTAGKNLIDRTRAHVKVELERDLIRKIVSDQAAMKNLGYVPDNTVQELIKTTRETAQKYNGQIEAAVKKWKDLDPPFWQPLDDALQEIVRYVDQHARQGRR